MVTDLRRLRESERSSSGRFRASAGPVLRWIVLVAASTLFLWTFREPLDKAHMALAFLLVVLAGSARHGRGIGLVLAVLGFLCFNYFLLPPYYTFVIADPLDWGVLVAFLITGAVAAQLLYRAQREAVIARQRAEEMDRLSTLGAETLNAGRAEEAVEAIARVIQSTLRVASCEIHLYERERGTSRLLGRAQASRWVPALQTDDVLSKVVCERVLAAERGDGATHFAIQPAEGLTEAIESYPDARVLLIPLQVRGNGLGVLQLADDEPIRLDAAQTRFAEVLAYYAALGVERVQLEVEAERVEALREADRLKEALLAAVSHDLRTPLTTIKGLAHEIRITGDDRAVAIEKEADRLNALVANLLDLSRLNAGAVPLSLEIVALEDLVGSALQRVSGLQAEHEIRVSLGEDGAMAVGRFDLAHSMRALVNLLENALKYSPPRTGIEVCVRRDGDFHTLSVLDRGPGIEPAEAERIFDPFYRPPGTEPDVMGTGLGLAIARRLAEAQDGAVRYKPRPGGGSIFSLCLPAVDLPDLREEPIPADISPPLSL